jgi:hypothetical protein
VITKKQQFENFFVNVLFFKSKSIQFFSGKNNSFMLESYLEVEYKDEESEQKGSGNLNLFLYKFIVN